MPRRPKTAAPVARVETREELEQLVGRYRECSIAQRSLEAEKAAMLQQIDERFRDRLSGIADELAALAATAEEWALRNYPAFGKAKSLALTHGVLMFRTGQPALRTIRGWTWDRVLASLRSIGAGVYVRERAEVAREQILADRETRGAEWLRANGMEVRQEERFHIEPKLEE